MIKTLLTTALALSSFAAAAYQVTANVADPSGETLPYVTYRIYNAADSVAQALVSNVTDEAGMIAQQLDSAATYRIELSYTGMAPASTTFTVSDEQPIANLGTLAMNEGMEQLETVTVTAQRPLVTRMIDRIGYDVQADPVTPTSMLSDVLRKVPMVSVDPDGTIKVNGSTNFKIYKNGRPNSSMSRNAKDLFAALPASMIKRVEVITEPGAEYDAEGTTAILNIITVENTMIKGVLGSAGVHWDTDSKIPGANLWMTSEIDKVTFNIYGGYQHFGGRNSRSNGYGDYLYPDGSHHITESFDDSKGNLGYFGVDASYQPDTLNLFTAEVNGYAYGFKNTGWGYFPIFAADGSLVSSYRTTTDSPSSGYLDIDANFNYQHNTHRPGETFTLSYMLSHTSQDNSSDVYYSDAVGIQLPYSAILSKFKLNFFEHTFQGDYARTIGIHKINAGVKGIFRRNHSINDFDYVGMGLVNDEFNHRTDIAAVYGQYTVSLKKVMMRAGLRYEYSHLQASYPKTDSRPGFKSDLNDIVPSAAISWQVTDAHSLSLNYSTSINRPGISYLNPAVTITPTSLSYGNPDLGSSRYQSIKLTYSLIKQKVNLNASVNYNYTDNAVSPIVFIDEDNLINSTYGNVGMQGKINFNVYMRWSITSKTRWMINGSLNYNDMRQQGLSMKRWSGWGYAQLSQELPWAITAELWGNYSNGYNSSVYSYYTGGFMSSLYYGLTLSRSFLKEKRLTARATVSNPIGPRYSNRTQHTVNGDYTGTMTYRHYMGPSVRLSISYRFGSLQAQVKKTAATISNDDLVGRKNE